ncbi:MAG: M28 family peptidase [Clostridia bacterium]|nr:M28 family peptidase [Clostridia bacterium]
MTQSSKTVLETYQVRKNKKQKAAFSAYVRSLAEQNGYLYTEERGAFGAKNLIVGDAQHAKVLYTAHYDTCARLPFPNFITPKNILIYLLYQLLITAALLLPPFVLLIGGTWVADTVAGLSTDAAMLWGMALFYLSLVGVFWLLLAGPANKHTANDNTSGVTLLLDVMQTMPKELRDNVAYIFFDLEEAGLFGSSGYRSKHKKQTQTQLLVNFDCVSDGKNFIFALRKGARSYAPAFLAAFPEAQGLQREVLTRGVFYPSDQANFPVGVGVAALRKSRFGGVLYMSRIHTKHDTVYEEENLSYLCDGCVRLTRLLSEQATR